jgi:hypothetical protein
MRNILSSVFAVVFMAGIVPVALSYNYFAFGSNMASSTMTNLRNLNPISSTAAVLHDHRLAFNVPGTPFVEPSWASVEIEKGSTVHGVLYELTEDDFAKVCQTEGVPLSYRLHRCQVVPYVGDGEKAGIEATNAEIASVPAFTLRAGRKAWRESKDIPPSQAYLNVLLRGAEEFKLDANYVKELDSIQCGRTILGNGLAEKMLQFAEAQNERKQ